MEMRKFIVEIHPDGRVYATEYEEPSERQYASDYDLEYIFSKAMDSVRAELDTLPWAKCSPSVKAAYLSGAASLGKKMCKAL